MPHNVDDSALGQAVSQDRGEVTDIVMRRGARADHGVEQQVSANFDLEEVETLLLVLASPVESGFTEADARSLARETAQMSPGQEKAWSYAWFTLW